MPKKIRRKKNPIKKTYIQKRNHKSWIPLVSIVAFSCVFVPILHEITQYGQQPIITKKEYNIPHYKNLITEVTPSITNLINKNSQNWEKLDTGKNSFRNISQINIDKSNIITVSYLQNHGVRFPLVAYYKHFKETSKCRCEYSGNRKPSLCCDKLIDIVGFNPNNVLGMKHPSVRNTTSLGRIGSFTLNESYNNDPHAVYESVSSAVKDYVYWQDFVFNIAKKKNIKIPQNDLEYIWFCERFKYNPKRSYFEKLEILVENDKYRNDSESLRQLRVKNRRVAK